MDEEQLQDWRDDLWPRCVELRDRLPDGFRLDFSAASLGRLQGVVGECLDEPGFRMEVAAYLGETLLRVAGGVWGWHETTDEPIVVPDPTLGLTTVRPLDLVDDAGASDGQFEVYAAWAAAAARRAAEEPGWQPVKELTDLDEFDDLDPAALREWLATRAAGFSWGAAFDFAPDSLPAVEDRLRAAAPTSEALLSAEHLELYETAVWYFGEVLRRGLGGEWAYDAPGPVNVGTSYVLVGPTWSNICPAVGVVASLGEPGRLREHYEAFAR